MNTAPSRRAAAAITSVLVLSACGSFPSGDDFLDQSPDSMVKTAFAEMREVTSMRILGSGAGDAGFLRLDLRLDDTSCTVRISTEEGNIQIIKNAEGAWFQADEQFWRSQTSSTQQGDQVWAAYGGSWVSVQGSNGRNKFVKLCDLDALLAEFKLDKKDTKGTLDAGEVEEMGDADAVPIHGRDGKQRVTAWVALEAPHHVLKMSSKEGTDMPDEYFFSSFGVDVEAETPPKKDIVTFPGG